MEGYRTSVGVVERVSATVGLSGNVGIFDLAVILEGMFKSMDSR